MLLALPGSVLKLRFAHWNEAVLNDKIIHTIYRLIQIGFKASIFAWLASFGIGLNADINLQLHCTAPAPLLSTPVLAT